MTQKNRSTPLEQLGIDPQASDEGTVTQENGVWVWRNAEGMIVGEMTERPQILIKDGDSWRLVERYYMKGGFVRDRAREKEIGVLDPTIDLITQSRRLVMPKNANELKAQLKHFTAEGIMARKEQTKRIRIGLVQDGAKRRAEIKKRTTEAAECRRSAIDKRDREICEWIAKKFKEEQTHVCSVHRLAATNFKEKYNLSERYIRNSIWRRRSEFGIVK